MNLGEDEKEIFWLFHCPEGPSRRSFFVWEEAAMPSHLQTALQQRPHLLPAQGPRDLPGPLGKNGFRDTTGVTQKGTRSPTGCYHLHLINSYFKNKKKRKSQQQPGWCGRCSKYGGTCCITANSSYREFSAWPVWYLEWTRSSQTTLLIFMYGCCMAIWTISELTSSTE